MRVFTTAMAVLALTVSANAAQAQGTAPTITRYAWTSTSGAFSRYALSSGSGPGSRYFLTNGSGPGSLYFFFSGTAPGSLYYFNSGNGPGSRYFLNNGSGPGSRYYWNNGSGCLSRHYWDNGGEDPPQRDPCNAESIVVFQTLCLTGVLTLEPCREIDEALNAARKEGAIGEDLWSRLVQLRQSQ